MSYEQPTPEELVRDALLQLMREISEDCWCAGWLIDLEYSLWEAILTGKPDFGWGISEPELARLAHLHKMADGWWIWDDETKGNRFVPTEEWLRIYARHKARLAV